MRICLSLILAAFVVLASYGASSSAIARAYVSLVCKTEDAALTIANMDQNNEQATEMMVRQFIQAGGCLFSRTGAWAMLAEKIYEYDDVKGKASGVWKMHGYDGWVILWDTSVIPIGKPS